MRTLLLRVLCFMAGVALAACSALNFEIPTKKVEYKSVAKMQPLDVPPDLVRPATDDRFNVPDGRGGAATFSEYQKDRGAREIATSGGAVMLPQQDNVRLERAGTERWLVVKGDPEQVWPVVKDFWQETVFHRQHRKVPKPASWRRTGLKVVRAFPTVSFAIRSANCSTSCIRRANATSSGHGSSGALKRARRRSTSVIAAWKRSIPPRKRTRRSGSRWPAESRARSRHAAPDHGRLGVQEEKAKSVVATAAPTVPRATLEKGGDGAALALNEQFDRAWRRVGLALDRVGFTVEDRDRSRGLYFVRYIDPDVDNKSASNKGLFSKFKFWGSSDDKEKQKEQYRVLVKDAGTAPKSTCSTRTAGVSSRRLRTASCHCSMNN